MDSRSGRKARHGEPMTGARKLATSPFLHSMSVIALAKVWIIPPGPCDMREGWGKWRNGPLFRRDDSL